MYWSRRWGGVFGRKPALHVFGDSHAKFIFRDARSVALHSLGPVTMHRVARDGKRALDLKDFDVQPGDVAVWCLGEIDVRCHILRQTGSQHAPLRGIVIPLAEGFLGSVESIEGEVGALHTVVLGVIPPTDQAPNREYPVAGTLPERVEARRALNAALRDGCGRRGFAFLDPFSPFEDETGALKPDMSDGNVHCGPDHAPLVARQVEARCAPWLSPAADSAAGTDGEPGRQ